MGFWLAFAAAVSPPVSSNKARKQHENVGGIGFFLLLLLLSFHLFHWTGRITNLGTADI